MKQNYFIAIIFMVLLSFSCVDKGKNNKHIYKSLVGDFVIEIPKELRFDIDSIVYTDVFGKQVLRSFKLYQTNLKNSIEIIPYYDFGPNAYNADGKYDILLNWVEPGCGEFANTTILLKKEITVNANQEKHINAYVTGRNIIKFEWGIDENYKKLITQVRFKFDDILFYILVRIYEGDQPYINILKDIELIDQIKIKRR